MFQVPHFFCVQLPSTKHLWRWVNFILKYPHNRTYYTIHCLRDISPQITAYSAHLYESSLSYMQLHPLFINLSNIYRTDMPVAPFRDRLKRATLKIDYYQNERETSCWSGKASASRRNRSFDRQNNKRVLLLMVIASSGIFCWQTNVI